MVTKEAKFLIINQPLAYIAIIDRPLMKKTSMVIAVYCLMIKFPTLIRVGYIKANPTTMRECHIQSLYMGKEAVRGSPEASAKLAIRGDVLVIEQRLGFDITLDSLDPRKEYLKSEPIGQTIDVQIS